MQSGTFLRYGKSGARRKKNPSDSLSFFRPLEPRNAAHESAAPRHPWRPAAAWERARDGGAFKLLENKGPKQMGERQGIEGDRTSRQAGKGAARARASRPAECRDVIYGKQPAPPSPFSVDDAELRQRIPGGAGFSPRFTTSISRATSTA